MVSNSSANSGLARIVKVRRAELRPVGHRPRPDPAMARIKAAFERREGRARARAVERPGRTPPQAIGTPVVAAEIVVHLAGFGPVPGAHLQYPLPHLAAPFDAEGLGLAPGKAVQEGDALEQKGLL